MKKFTEKRRQVKIGLVDDHELFRKGISMVLSRFRESGNEELILDIVMEADNGKDLIVKIENGVKPDIIFLDINMPKSNGVEAAEWLQSNYPEIKIIVLTMYNSGDMVNHMLKLGASSYLTKASNQETILEAIQSVLNEEIYLPNGIIKELLTYLYGKKNQDQDREHHILSFLKNIKIDPLALSDKEIELVKLISAEMTNKQIAEKMNLSPRTIDGYRDALFEKFGVKTRAGLVIAAIKYKLLDV